MGACLVNSENEIIGTGCNRMPNGCKGKLPWTQRSKSKDDLDNKHLYGMWLFQK